MNFLKSSFILFSLFTSSLLLASGSTGYGEISTIQQRECVGDKGFEINLLSSHGNPDGCENSVKLNVSCDLPAFNQFVSMSLLALAANKKIRAYVSGCDSEGQAKVIAITIQK